MQGSMQTLGTRSSGGAQFSGRATVKPLRATWLRRGAVVVNARAARYDRNRPPPPDLPSLLFDHRIVFLGMPLVPAVTELMVAELLYLEKQGASLPIEMLINSSGTTRQNGEILAFDSEGVALTSTMGFVKNPISTVNMGLAAGWSCVVLSLGKKGWRKSLPHSLALLQQPRVPPTGAQQAVEVHLKWREVLGYKRDLLRMLSAGTGWTVDKLDADMQRSLYMRPRDALEYGIIDTVIEPNEAKQDKAARYWLKSGRAESDGRLEQWAEYLYLQEEQALKYAARKATAQSARAALRNAYTRTFAGTKLDKQRQQELKDALPQEAITEDGQVRLPFTKEGLRMALLNAERYADAAVDRLVRAGKIKVPERWERAAAEMADEVAAAQAAAAAHRPPQAAMAAAQADAHLLLAVLGEVQPRLPAAVAEQAEARLVAAAGQGQELDLEGLLRWAADQEGEQLTVRDVLDKIDACLKPAVHS